MGTTIRRQPLSFPIPASPDYRFLNITDFGGLNISSNPFVVSSNTASDCLNVYVDEDNALSTRPRLQAKYDLMCLAGLGDEYELIDVYALHDGYLLHVKKNGYGYMYKFVEENGVLQNPTPISGTTPTEKCKIFEQKGNIYLLTKDGYKNIINNHISDVEGYVPTIRIGSTNKKDGADYESYNLLSSQFKETFFWDGTWSTDSLKEYESDVIQNNYIKNRDFYITNENGNDFDTLFIIQPVGGMSDSKTNKKYFLCYLPDYYDVFKSEYVLMAVDEHNKMIVDETFGIPFKLSQYDVNGSFTYEITNKTFACSENGLCVACVSWNSNYNKPNLLYACTRTDTNSNFKQTIHGTGPYLPTDETQVGFYPNQSGEYFKISSDGRVVSWRSTENKITIDYYYDFTKSPDANEGKDTEILNGSLYDLDVYDATTYVISYIEPKSENVNEIDSIKIQRLIKTADSKSRWFLRASGGVYRRPWNDFETPATITLKVIPHTTSVYASILLNENSTLSRSVIVKIYASESSTDIISESFVSKKWSGLRFKNDIDNKYMYYQNETGSITGRFNIETGEGVSSDLNIPVDITSAHITDTLIVGLSTITHTNVYWYNSSEILLDSKEPLLTLIRHIENIKESVCVDYDKCKKLLISSRITERFDNNTWFASKNHTFHTQYNDPTYVPLSSYNDLGEDFEDITGLSIVNDNVLAAYKHNRIYIITPITVGDELTYSYTETKNVIGNDVPDAPILTILTEMPTIVSYDGIFALNQLENVQSSDRITTLISENINPRWLKESKQDIDDCKTLNRLYWTYYILPHKQVGDETADYTKIYLLDNRTQQWYYWELPIYVMNAMIKDNKTHFIHEDGTVYTLETTDLIHEFNPDVTEYYDGVGGEKLIIPWNWTSQILSLNTINYSKKLVDTTFVLTDTDTQDEYGLDYSFKAWRKSVSETNATTISNNIHYVQSTTKRTMIPRFNFIQIRLSNTSEDLDNNKLRLVGLGLKYVLLEGLY